MESRSAAVAKKNNDRVFVGKGWANTSRDGKTEYINLTLDRGVKLKLEREGVEYTFPEGASIQLFQNAKREGKKDADYRASFRTAPAA